MKKLVLLPLLIAAMVVVTSCGYGGGQTKQTPPTPVAPSPTPPTPTTPTPTTPAVNGEVQVVMQNLAFIPGSITIDKGTKVTWTNKDSVPHTVTESNGLFKSSEFGNGGTFSYTFNQTGTYNYSCGIHPGMTGTVTVK